MWHGKFVVFFVEAVLDKAQPKRLTILQGQTVFFSVQY